MAFSNYGELKADVADWINRDDDDEILARVPSFIALAERKIFRKLRCPANEVVLRIDDYDGEAGYPLPIDYLEARTVRWNDTSLNRISDRDQRRAATGDSPQHFARVGQRLYLYPAPSGTGSLELAYWQDQSGLSADADTNNILLVAPDLYLYGALIAAEPFLENDSRTALWRALYQEAFDEVQDMADAAELAGGASITRSTY